MKTHVLYAMLGVMFVAQGVNGIWSSVADAIVGRDDPPTVTVMNVPDGGSGKRKVRLDEQATIQTTPESVIVINALKRATQQGGNYTAEVTGTQNATYILAECTFNDTTQDSSKRVDLKIELYDPSISEWVVVASGSRNAPSPGENFAIATLSSTRFKGGRQIRGWISAAEQITSGVNFSIYDTPPEPE